MGTIDFHAKFIHKPGVSGDDSDQVVSQVHAVIFHDSFQRKESHSLNISISQFYRLILYLP